MRSRRHQFTPALDAVEARLLMASGTTAALPPAASPSSVGDSSATANPILYAYTQAYLSHLGQPNYNPAVDTNHGGYVGRKDAAALLRAVTPNARKTPLYLTLSLAAGEQVNTPHPANSGGVTRDPTYITIIGHTLPNSLVFTDDSNSDFRFRGGGVIAVNAQGWFSDTIEVSGPNKLAQHNFEVVTPSLQTIRRAFPVLQLVTPVKPRSTSS